MTDKDYLEEYLLILKSTVEVYVHGTLESSNSDIKEVLWNGLDETLKHQSDLYDKLLSKNSYVVNNIDSSIISKTIKKLEK